MISSSATKVVSEAGRSGRSVAIFCQSLVAEDGLTRSAHTRTPLERIRSLRVGRHSCHAAYLRKSAGSVAGVPGCQREAQ
jgi:hypothetical protein